MRTLPHSAVLKGNHSFPKRLGKLCHWERATLHSVQREEIRSSRPTTSKRFSPKWFISKKGADADGLTDHVRGESANPSPHWPFRGALP